MRPSARAVALLAGVATLGACAPHRAGSVAAVPEPAHAAGAGTIVAVRPIASRIPGGILAALGAGSADRPAAGQTCEFIVRVDAGPTVSLVQVNEAGFSAGDRVLLVGGERTRLARMARSAGA